MPENRDHSEENDIVETTEDGNPVVKDETGAKIEIELPSEKPKSTDTDDDDYGEYGEKVKKRIGKEVAKRRQEERKRKELEQRVAAMQAQLATTSKHAAVADFQTVQSREQQIAAQMTAAQNMIRQARMAGDINAEISAQNALAACHADAKALALYKQNNAARFQQALKGGPQQQQNRQARPQPKRGPALAPEAKRWIESNEWFHPQSPNFDSDKHKAAIQINDELESEGYDRTTTEFYRELNKRLQAKTGKRSSPVGAPARGSSAPARKVQLSKFQVEFAKKHNIPLDRMAREIKDKD